MLVADRPEAFSPLDRCQGFTKISESRFPSRYNVNLKVEDYYPSGKRFLLRFKEKGGKEKELPVHHKLEEMLDQYLKATGLEKEPESPLFPAALRKTGKLSRRSAHANRRRGHAQTPAQASRVASSLFASLISGDRHHEFFGKRRHP